MDTDLKKKRDYELFLKAFESMSSQRFNIYCIAIFSPDRRAATSQMHMQLELGKIILFSFFF